MPRRVNVFFLGCVAFFLAMSCDSNSVYDEYQSLPNQWDMGNELAFQFKAPDTINNYNLYVNLRNNKDYKFSNLYLITTLQYPNGKTIIDTLEYKMAEPNGELLGTGFTDVKENKLWYKGYNNPFSFNEAGMYTFKVQHAMRKFNQVNGVSNLKGITEVGFRVEKK
ncbi:MAG: gliding motility lipoprotein GldH [Winogradskyella sp.]|uniref:gliding motility lipoprotein GldH n=1 Tax=Winogradskyella sp. TaxID=1883156 RepID=UPI001809BA72|nr:gliding motility lipoprotein GldH [Winogradskyella sp.]MBT8246031.1 gliding motility lipoprotein GldH [Winogradskyella sp.]NNK22240.1 gliding motility lipoprotein GldH [Winogradskyella sp.]